jgi:integrase
MNLARAYPSLVSVLEPAEEAHQKRRGTRRIRRGDGWHTFRHTYRSWLDENGAPMKVQQELMRHDSIQTTMNVYGRAMAETKRRANSQVVGLVFGHNSKESEAVDSATTAL